MAAPDVTVIVATLNAAATIDSALQSVIREAGAVSRNVEILVIDGDSRDGTADIVAKYPQVGLLRQTSTGLAGARNEAIAKSQASLVAFCDADDQWVEGSLTTKLDIMAESAHTWAVTGRVRFDQTTTNSAGFPPRRRVGEEHEGYTPGAMLVRRHALQAVAFDPQLALAADADWFMRAISSFGQMFHLDETVLIKGLRAGSLSTDVVSYREELLTSAHRYLRALRSSKP